MIKGTGVRSERSGPIKEPMSSTSSNFNFNQTTTQPQNQQQQATHDQNRLSQVPARGIPVGMVSGWHEPGFNTTYNAPQNVGNNPNNLAQTNWQSQPLQGPGPYPRPQGWGFDQQQNQYNNNQFMPTQQNQLQQHNQNWQQTNWQQNQPQNYNNTNWQQQQQLPNQQQNWNQTQQWQHQTNNFDASLNDRAQRTHQGRPPQYDAEDRERRVQTGALVHREIKNPDEFVYNYDFDDNGALYWLGSYGKSRVWQNPHTCGQVHCFASSIGQGNVENFVGRVSTNTRTANEAYSYFGVDLGDSRLLMPTCYTIMNRNSTTHVMMNWHLEGSNDMKDWIILDRRIYLSDNPYENYQLEEEQKLLKKKGATSTWAISQDVIRQFGARGFRYFRIVQVGKNSSGSDNLALSGFELYGKVCGGKWA